MEDAAPQTTRERILSLAHSGAVLAGVGLSRVVSRTVWWGLWGLLGGIVLALAVPMTGAPTWARVLTALLYILGTTAALGYAGFWRGVGRFVIYLGVSEGWVLTLLAGILDRTFRFFRRSRRLDAALDASELWAMNLPLVHWEAGLKASITARLGADDFAESQRLHRRFLGLLHRLTCRVIEAVLLRIVRQESCDRGGGGVSMARVRQLALQRAELLFIETVEGAMNKQLLVVLALTTLAAALPPLLLSWLS